MNVYYDMALLYSQVFKNEEWDKRNVSREIIFSTEGVQFVLLKMYDTFISQKSIKPIEDLEKADKEKLAAQAREIKVDFTNKTLIMYCKMLHVINAINQ